MTVPSCIQTVQTYEYLTAHDVHMGPTALREIRTMVQTWYTSHLGRKLYAFSEVKEVFGYLKNPSLD